MSHIELDLYDNEYFSRKSHTKKSMVDLIKKYVDLNKISSESQSCDLKKTLDVFYKYKYEIEYSKEIQISKKLNNSLPTFEIKFLFK